MELQSEMGGVCEVHFVDLLDMPVLDIYHSVMLRTSASVKLSNIKP